MISIPNEDLSNFFHLLWALVAAATAVAIGASCLVDSAKSFWGGPSNFGFGYIQRGLEELLDGENTEAMWRLLRANWINGVDKSDQKAAAKAMIRLCLKPATARSLAATLRLDDAEQVALATASEHEEAGTALTQQDTYILQRFDCLVSIIVEACYERADQKYRYAIKLLALIQSTVLAIIGGWVIFGGYSDPHQIVLALMVGIVSAPFASVVKDVLGKAADILAAVVDKLIGKGIRD